jgi:argininosuccinate synthase
VDCARKEKAQAIAHGATSKSNDQVRLDLGIIALAPDLEIIVPWHVWNIKKREQAMRYLAKRGIPAPVKKKNAYSRDENIWNISHEGLELEDSATEPAYKSMLINTVTPEKAPSKPTYVEIGFDKGIPITLNGKKMEGLALIKELNNVGGANGIGINDLVEDRVVGMKCRSVYETPAGTILHYAHHEMEHLCLDRQTYSFKQQIGLKFAELIYDGFWFTPLCEALCAFVDSTQASVSGTVRLKLYKGSVSSAGSSSPSSMYHPSIATLDTNDLYNNIDAKGFARLYGLPVLTRSLIEHEKKRKPEQKKNKQ